MRIESPVVIGRGDVLLKYPELLDDYDPNLLPPQPYVAVHLHASHPSKIPPKEHILIEKLLAAGVRFVEVGNDVNSRPPMILRLHIDVVKRARKFIGTLSVFNVVAQIMEIPSFVLVDRSKAEPLVYRYMQANSAIVRAWNNCPPFGHFVPVEKIYQEAVEWAKI
jgi:hypothetical protein